MSDSKKRILILSGVAIIAILLIFATFFDLQISFLLADLKQGEILTSNIYAIIIEIIGESILYLFLVFAFSVVFWWAKFNIQNRWKIFYQVLVCIAIFLIYYIFINKSLGYISFYMSIHFNYYLLIFSIFFSIILTFLTIFSLKLLKKKHINVLIKFAIVIICVAIISNLITQITKTFVFGRIRFRAMNYLNDYSYYTPWFFLNGTSLLDNLQHLGLTADMFRSCPSGHSTAAAITFSLICLPDLFKKFSNRIWKIFCWTVPIVTVLIVGLARIIAGAHFLSDVLVAAIITLLLTLLFRNIFINAKKAQKYQKY